MTIKRWTEQEVARVQEMRRNKIAYEVIAHALGRSTKSIKTQLSYAKMTPDQRERRAQYERDRRAGQNKTLAKEAGIKFEAHKSVVPAAVISERNRRIDAPFRDLTAAIFGDPPVGYSALERRA